MTGSMTVGYQFTLDTFSKDVPVSLVQQKIAKYKIPWSAVPVSARGIFGRIKNQLAKMQKDKAILQLPRMKENRERKVIYQVSGKVVDDTRTLGLVRDSQFWFDPLTESVGSDDPIVAKKVKDEFERLAGLFNKSDLFQLTLKVFEMQKGGGILSLTQRGGTYFVDPACRELLDSITAFVLDGDIGGSCSVLPIGAADRQSQEQAVKRLITESQQEVQSIVSEVRELMKAQREGAKDTFGKAAARGKLETLRKRLERIRTFAGILSADATAIVEKVGGEELDLSAVSAPVETLIAMAQSGDISGCLANLVLAAEPDLASTQDLKPATEEEAPVPVVTDDEDRKPIPPPKSETEIDVPEIEQTTLL